MSGTRAAKEERDVPASVVVTYCVVLAAVIVVVYGPVVVDVAT